MFNNRWSVRADFFTSTTKDLLIRKQLPETSSLEYSLTNDGKLKNKGFEIATNMRILNLRSWQLDFGAMLGHYKNKIVSLAGGSYTTDFREPEFLLPRIVLQEYSTDTRLKVFSVPVKKRLQRD